ncbi:hypothetical protein FFI89_013685 [Bradyrhizobium sp. KBS0727]|uniref:hypothetical protein n=1 Tax=unclassified Bradyrhizobium TaxID=2631580 RepID=UPI00110F51DA|nr:MULTISPECIES: hypothetical protein [unclassified Bradyrhizobium]QDW38108.1 hypothetical protein FFI71_013680 [Bradyrhizobium sp. KBS0725]QDW44712.1 hypothetical protein FFI89_013685 [Bradyrhizobium sp. KBS0727]
MTYYMAFLQDLKGGQGAPFLVVAGIDLFSSLFKFDLREKARTGKISRRLVNISDVFLSMGATASLIDHYLTLQCT